MALFLSITLFLSSAFADIADPSPSQPSDDSGEKDTSDETGCSTLSQGDIGLILLPVVVLGGAVMFRKED